MVHTACHVGHGWCTKRDPGCGKCTFGREVGGARPPYEKGAERSIIDRFEQKGSLPWARKASFDPFHCLRPEEAVKVLSRLFTPESPMPVIPCF